ncbi:MAG: methyltransferase domain-containing protein [Xanthomonadales bacterium]|nr:methyltransferase domain-containing protein [Xanthomonadales bacterium]
MAKQQAAQLLFNHLDLLTSLESTQPVLDLACGDGRNGLVLAESGVDVVFADKSESALAGIDAHLTATSLPGSCWQVDLEVADINPLAERQFSAILGFRYLHRPLFPALIAATMPTGLVIYETFTTENRRFGRPNNPNFLLQPGELEAIFQDWEIIYSFEGILKKPERAVAQIVARKPGIGNTLCLERKSTGLGRP